MHFLKKPYFSALTFACYFTIIQYSMFVDYILAIYVAVVYYACLLFINTKWPVLIKIDLNYYGNKTTDKSNKTTYVYRLELILFVLKIQMHW